MNSKLHLYPKHIVKLRSKVLMYRCMSTRVFIGVLHVGATNLYVRRSSVSRARREKNDMSCRRMDTRLIHIEIHKFNLFSYLRSFQSKILKVFRMLRNASASHDVSKLT